MTGRVTGIQAVIFEVCLMTCLTASLIRRGSTVSSIYFQPTEKVNPLNLNKCEPYTALVV